MTLLSFLIDLRSLPLPLLRDIKQGLLQLANLYAISRANKASPLKDRIGLCYLRRSQSAPHHCELKIAYRPGEGFNLRDFHHAVNNLPCDGFLPELMEGPTSESSGEDFPLAELLNDKALYSWGGEDCLKKVVVISSSVFCYTEALRKLLLDAAERYISLEFVLFELENGCTELALATGAVSSINDLENCMLRRYFPDTLNFCGLVKRWLQELGSETEEPLQATLLFKNDIIDSVNKINCNLFPTSNPIIDGFSTCQMCRCHGMPVDNGPRNNKNRYCSVTFCELVDEDILDNSVRVGEQTILFLPSFHGYPTIRRISGAVTFKVIERVDLATLNEGVIQGTPYIVAPSACPEMEDLLDEYDKSELNSQLFHGLRRALFLLDQGLVCSSTCNTETHLEQTFQCFYILQPSEKGPMLLKRLAGAEEILPVPDTGQSSNMAIPFDIENSVQATLSKIELKDYNPLQHERGFHSKLNWIIKESLQFGSVYPQKAEAHQTFDRMFQASIVEQPLTQVPENGHPDQRKEEHALSSMAEEWEQLLIIHELDERDSSAGTGNKKFHNSLPTQNKSLDEKTSRILERLEAPKPQKPKVDISPISGRTTSGLRKKPLMPFNSSSGQPLKPSFQRMKRKPKVEGLSILPAI